MLGRWKAFAAGESTILDDRGHAMPVYDSSKGEKRPKIIESIKRPEVDGPFADESAAKRIGRWIFVGVSTLVTFGFIVYYGWLFSGWVGQTLLGLSGVLAYIGGGTLLVGAFMLFTMVAFRWENAGRSVRTKHGKRVLDDHLAIYEHTHAHGVCTACKFTIIDLNADRDGFVLCPECGAAWNTDWWKDFLITEEHEPIAMSKGKRAVYCQLDARNQAFEVMRWVPRRERVQHCGSWQIGFRLADWFSVVFALLVVTLIVLIVYHNSSTLPIMGALAIVGTCVLALIATVAFLQLGRRSRTRRLQCFVRTQIDDRKCPHCDHKLSEDRHPIDDAIMCPGCWHAWDPNTAARSHHSRQTLNTEDFNRHPAFRKRS